MSMPERMQNRGITESVRQMYFDKNRTPARSRELWRMYRDVWKMIEYYEKVEKVEGFPPLSSYNLLRLAAQLYYLHNRRKYRCDMECFRWIAHKLCITEIRAKIYCVNRDVLDEDWLRRQQPLYKHPGRPATRELRAEELPIEQGAPAMDFIEPLMFTLHNPDAEEEDGNKKGK